MDFLLLSLFSGGVLQVLGAVVGFKWINDGKVEVGGLCSAQGITQQLGETVEALTILVIVVYAFLGGWLRKDIKTWSIWITQGLLTAIWLFVAVMVLLGNIINRGKGNAHFEAPTPYWCWIGADYFQWRLWGQYFWFWLTLGVSFLTCIPLYIWSRGNLQFDEHAWWKFRLQKAELSADSELKAIKRQSLVMLAYSVVYCISILPLSIVRWISFISDSVHISLITSLAVATIFSLTPASNVVLLLATRTDSIFFGKPKNFTSGCPPLREYSLHELEKSKDGKNIGSEALESSI